MLIGGVYRNLHAAIFFVREISAWVEGGKEIDVIRGVDTGSSYEV